MPQAVAPASKFQVHLARAIQHALAGEPVRVRQVRTPVGPVWIKRVERLSLRWRLQKGDGRKLFERDREALRLLADAGLPVAPILAEGDGYFVTPDLGTDLQTLLQNRAVSRTERRAALREAGYALARMHRSGFCHGRPALRDLCWNGQSVHFIDLEMFSPRRNRRRHFATDLLILVHSLVREGGTAADLDAIVGAYRAAVSEATWAQIHGVVRRIGWLGGVTRVIQMFRPRSQDVAAVARTFAYVASLN